MKFDDLPTEMKLEIFSYLDTKDLCKSVVPVCKEWRTLGHDPHLWKSVKIAKYNDRTSSSISNVLIRCPFLKELTLVHVPNWLFTPSLVYCPALRKLELISCDRMTSSIALEFVEFCPNIEDLKLTRCTIDDRDIIKQFVKWKKLKNISLNIFSTIADYHQEIIVNAIANHCNNLQVLDISKLKCVPRSAFENLTRLRGTTLRSLCLSGTTLVRDSEPLRNCPYLSELRVKECARIVNNELSPIKELRCLKHLEITFANRISSISLSSIFGSTTLENLVELNLTGCMSVDNFVVESVAKCCSSLKILNLNSCVRVTEDGLEFISFYCRLLEQLHMQCLPKVTCESLIYYREALKSMNYLDLTYCANVTFDTICRMVEINTKLSVSWCKRSNPISIGDMKRYCE